MTEISEHPLTQAAAWVNEGRSVVLATVVQTWGSAPRQPGSQMCIDDQGRFVGSVSGGCVEGAVIEEARSVMETGEPRLLTYGVTDEMAWEVGLACGGEVRIFVEAIR